MPEKVKNIREARNVSKLPSKLRDIWLVGSFDDTLFLASTIKREKFEVLEDTFVYGYSLENNEITNCLTIKGGDWPESWTQHGSLIYLGTRGGNIIAFDMKTGDLIGKRKFKNLIDTLTIDNSVFLGVNGFGVYKVEKDLSTLEKKYAKEEVWNWQIGDTKGRQVSIPVSSAMTFFQNSLYVFHFSCANEDKGGGLVEILDRNLKPLSERKSCPYATCVAISDDSEIFFATADVSNGWIESGEGSFYSLNPSDLSYKELTDLSAAVKCIARQRDNFLLGLKDGSLVISDRKGKLKQLYWQRTPINGIIVKDEKVYVAEPGKIIEIN